MSFMGFNRVQAKMQAKAAMGRAYPHPMLVTLVYLLATTVLTWVIGVLVTNPFTEMLAYLEAGYEPDVVLAYVMRGNRVMLYVLLSVLMALYTQVMSFGYTSYSLRLARGEQPSYRNLLDGFSIAGRVILAGILMAVFFFLWEMAVIIPAVLVVILLAAAGAEVLATMVGVALALGAWVFLICVLYRYALTYYFLLDYPNMTARQAIAGSKRAMQGHKWELFVLELSFLGWFLLSALTLGILGLWVTPYNAATTANFYDAVVNNAQPNGDVGPYPGGGPL